jgi:CRP-like cAMP-binding protein
MAASAPTRRKLIVIKKRVDFCGIIVAHSAGMGADVTKTSRVNSCLPAKGPAFIAPSMWSVGENPGHPLSEEEQAVLAAITTVVRYKKGEIIYKEGDRATAAFNIISGVVKSYCERIDGGQPLILGFLFPKDLLGLAENGKYVNSAEAVTAVTAYKMPAAALEVRLKTRPVLDLQVIAKVCHDLRAAQRHAVLLSKNRSIARIGFFIQMLEAVQADQAQAAEELYLPMTYSDVAAYTAMSPESVSRAFRDLANRGAIALRDRRHLRITDRAVLEAAISERENRRPIALPEQ